MMIDESFGGQGCSDRHAFPVVSERKTDSNWREKNCIHVRTFFFSAADFFESVLNSLCEMFFIYRKRHTWQKRLYRK